MSDLDILAAFEGTGSAIQSSRRCKLGRWLDEIPEDTPGRSELIAATETTDRTNPAFRAVDQVDKILYRLGLVTSTKTIGDHRFKRCRCWV